MEHVIPPGVFEMPYAVSSVAMVGDAYQVAKKQVVDAGFFMHFPQCGCGDVLARVLMTFRQVPESASADQKVVSAPVRNQSAARIHLQEFCTDLPVGIFCI